MYENVHPNLAMVLLFVRTEVECGKGLFTETEMFTDEYYPSGYFPRTKTTASRDEFKPIRIRENFVVNHHA